MMKLPQTGTFIELDPHIGWEAAIDHLSPITPPGLAVDCVPGQPTAFAKTACGQPVWPKALARHGCEGKLFVLDDGVNRVKSIDLKLQREYATITGFGGSGTDARHFRRPQGLAVLEDGSLVIADTGHHQIKIFSRYPNALLAVWGDGKSGKAPGQFHSPGKVAADRCGLIYIADRGNGRIQRIQREGRLEAPITGLKAPSGVAVAPDGTLAVVDTSIILIYAPGQLAGPQSFAVPLASCVTFDDKAYIYVGTSTALIYKFEPVGDGTYRNVGIGVTGISGQLLDLLWTPEAQLVGILLPHCAPAPALSTFQVCGNYLSSGTLLTKTLDSGIESCIWDRVQLHATVPQGTVIEVTTQTADSDVWAKGAPYQAECSAYSVPGQSCVLSLTGDDPDCLVQSRPGRYLRLQLKLKSNGVVSPTLQSIQVGFPRSSYLQYLPAVYQEDDQSRVFLDRFLRIFQSTFDGMDQTLDNLWTRFDPMSAPGSWFNWLASWLAFPINPLWSDNQRRSALKSAGQIYPLRGTPSGVEQLVKQYSGVDARLIEHFRLRQLVILPDSPSSSTALGSGMRLWSRDYYRRLQVGVYSQVGYFDLTGEPEPDMEPLAWGANEFTVFFDCDPYQVSSTTQSVSQVVEREKPAYAKANYAPVFPRMRVGVQSTLGVDTRVGEITPLLLGTTGVLDYDAILGCSTTETQLRAQRTTLQPQLDVNARLL
ncbi:MAG TPA: phage tail protein [Candidatus Solibacter sp.]|nr:phage tail protein [Candidatus Solibacter sp.]